MELSLKKTHFSQQYKLTKTNTDLNHTAQLSSLKSTVCQLNKLTDCRIESGLPARQPVIPHSSVTVSRQAQIENKRTYSSLELNRAYFFLQNYFVLRIKYFGTLFSLN